MDVYFKFVGQFTNYKQLSYLSFYINQKGDKIKYDPNLPLGALYKVRISLPRIHKKTANIAFKNIWKQSMKPFFIINLS